MLRFSSRDACASCGENKFRMLSQTFVSGEAVFNRFFKIPKGNYGRVFVADEDFIPVRATQASRLEKPESLWVAPTVQLVSAG